MIAHYILFTLHIEVTMRCFSIFAIYIVISRQEVRAIKSIRPKSLDYGDSRVLLKRRKYKIFEFKRYLKTCLKITISAWKLFKVKLLWTR